MPTGAPDHYKSILLFGVDEDGNLVKVLVDKEGRIIFREVTTVETSTQGGNPTVSAGDQGISSNVVPVGARWIVSSIACMNLNTMNSSVQIYVHDGVAYRLLKSQNSPSPLESTDWQGSLVMEPGWYIRFVFNGCAGNDTLYWGIAYCSVVD